MAGMDGDTGRAAWLKRISPLGLLGLYFAVIIACPIIGAMLFFFPILPLYTWMGWEFSNLGPIATFFWGIALDILVITPTFIILLVVKFVLYVARK